MENNNFKTPAVTEKLTSIESKSDTAASSSAVSADELKAAIYNLGGKKQDKNERNVIITGSTNSKKDATVVEKPAVEEKKEEVKTDEKPALVVEGVKPAETPKETPKEVNIEPAPTLSEQIAAAVKEQLAGIVGQKAEESGEEIVEEVVEPEITAADITPEILADPAKTSEMILKSVKQLVGKSVKQAVADAIKTEIEPFKKQITPVANKIVSDTITNHQKAAVDKFPELGTDEKFKSDVKKFITENKDLINSWHAKGINPYLKVAQIVKSDNLEGLLKLERDKAIKETEERMKKASGAFGEGGGKPSPNKPIDIENMSADEMKQLINSSKR